MVGSITMLLLGLHAVQDRCGHAIVGTEDMHALRLNRNEFRFIVYIIKTIMHITDLSRSFIALLSRHIATSTFTTTFFVQACRTCE
jgi:hypothetical protein